MEAAPGRPLSSTHRTGCSRHAPGEVGDTTAQKQIQKVQINDTLDLCRIWLILRMWLLSARKADIWCDLRVLRFMASNVHFQGSRWSARPEEGGVALKQQNAGERLVLLLTLLFLWARLILSIPMPCNTNFMDFSRLSSTAGCGERRVKGVSAWVVRGDGGEGMFSYATSKPQWNARFKIPSEIKTIRQVNASSDRQIKTVNETILKYWKMLKRLNEQM